VQNAREAAPKGASCNDNSGAINISLRAERKLFGLPQSKRPDARRGLRVIWMPEDENKEDINRKTGIAYAAAFSLFAAVVSGLLLGWLLDRWLGTKPWLLVAGVTLGSIAGFFEFIRSTSKLS